MDNYNNNRKFGDAFMPVVKAILGQFLLTDDCGEEDTLRNTDLISLNMAAKRVGVRIRRASYLTLFPDDFTIRFSLSSGLKTEFQKIMDGWGDYFFYGIADCNTGEAHLAKWMIVDYSKFRNYILNGITIRGREYLEEHIKTAYSGGNEFLAFNRNEMPLAIAADSETWIYDFWKNMIVTIPEDEEVKLPFDIKEV